MTKPPSLQIMAWSTVKISLLPTNTDRLREHHQLACHIAWFDSITELPFIQVEAHFSERSTVSHTNDPFSTAMSGTRLVFGGTLFLILSTVSLSSSAFLLLTVCCADLKRESFGSRWVWDIICSTRIVVTLTNWRTLALLSDLDFQGKSLEALGYLYLTVHSYIPLSQ